MYDRRNICAARTRIGHRALRERRPPPRGTRGIVTAVACPRFFSFVSLKRRAAWQPGPAPPVPLPAERRRGTEGGVGAFLLLRPERAEGGQGEMSRTAGSERPPLREMNESGEDRERWAGLRSGPDGATAPRAYARSQANGVSARRLREMINLAPAVEGLEKAPPPLPGPLPPKGAERESRLWPRATLLRRAGLLTE